MLMITTTGTDEDKK